MVREKVEIIRVISRFKSEIKIKRTSIYNTKTTDKPLYLSGMLEMKKREHVGLEIKVVASFAVS